MARGTLDRAHAVLAEVFGFSSFRGLQEQVIQHIFGGGDCLVLMPTGGGKSLCYQLPATILPGTAVVISPLIALMDDQVGALIQMGIKAGALHSGMSLLELRFIEESFWQGKLDLLYVSPERAVTERFREMLERRPPSLFAIDEAHCVSQWGHNFRPEYLELPSLYQHFAQVPRVALTATADTPTRKDILDRLALRDPAQFIAGFDRPNIFYQALVKDNPVNQLTRFLATEHSGDSGIVYAQTRKRVESTASALVNKGFPALPYHAGLEPSMRKQHQKRFINEEGLIMVATVAFGMGIDKSNVRFVCHLDMPKSLEAYYQETGRAGRDGLPANAWMAYGLQDVVGMRQLMASSGGSESHRMVEHRKLDAMLGFCESVSCRRHTLLSYFGETPPENCGDCDNCRNPPEGWDATVPAQKLLSCVYRTGQRFGARYLADVLLGKTSDRLESYGHHKLPTFGVGKDLGLNEWMSVVRQLVASGFLTPDPGGGLVLAPRAGSVLKGETPVWLRRDPPKTKAVKKRKTARISVGGQLWERLREKRLELAREQGVPPYMIFHDSTLQEMAVEKPSTTRLLANISGVGQKKLERYGKVFLAVIKEFG